MLLCGFLCCFLGKLYGSVAALVEGLSCAFWRICGKARRVSLLRLLSRAELAEKQESDAEALDSL